MCGVKLSVDLGKPSPNCCGTMNSAKLYLIAKCAFRTCVIAANHIYYLTYLILMGFLYPLKICGFQDLFYKLEGQLHLGLLHMITMWSRWAGYSVLEVGDDISPCLEERTLVLVNHQTTGDVPMLFNAFISRSQIIPNVMWIMDMFLKYSHFGLVCMIRRDFFIVQGKELREKSLESLSNHLFESYLPLKRKWLVLFPEGGFLYKRKESSQRYGLKNNLPHLEHVTIPRVGALQVILNRLNPKRTALNNNTSSSEEISTEHLKYILDITIGYPNAEPIDILTLLIGDRPPCQTTILYRLYPIGEVPQDNEGISKWLLDRWVEKEKLLETFQKTGEFPIESNSITPKLVKQKILPYLGFHVIYLTSTFFQYRIFMLACQYCYNLVSQTFFP